MTSLMLPWQRARFCTFWQRGAPEPTFIQEGIEGVPVGRVEVRVSESLLPNLKEKTLEGALADLMGSIEPF